MAYCRWGEDGSDFYIYTDGDEIHVYGPQGISQRFPAADDKKDEILSWLVAQVSMGHRVPEYVFLRLQDERDGKPYRTRVQRALDEFHKGTETIMDKIERARFQRGGVE